jgi:hypothetical protein
MYFEYNDTIAITKSSWKAAGLTDDMLWKDSGNKDLRILHRGIKGNTIIDVKSIKRPDRLAVIEAAFGKIKQEIAAANTITQDAELAEKYRTYTYTAADGKEETLPDKTREIYANNASILEAMHRSWTHQVIAQAANGKKPKRGEFYQRVAKIARELNANKMPNSLDKDERTVERIYKKYFDAKEDGWLTLIHPNYGNRASEKLCEEAKYWLIARWATPINKLTLQQLTNEYNKEVEKHEDWKKVKTHKPIETFLYRPEIRPIWEGMRHGELSAKEKYTRQHRTLLPTMRDSLWYGDGTKLNFYYLDDNGKMTTANVYEVIDAYSECFLGFHVSASEDFEAQYFAFRMALQFSGYKPYEIRFDNQGGHKKLQSGEFFKKLSHLAINTAPYNGRSKTIESAFGRFQAQVMHKLWFFTGQNITAKKEESRPNMEFILANKENLPTLQEAIKQYKECRHEWNADKHFKTGIPRIVMYQSSNNPEAKKLDLLDMIEVFGIMNTRGCTYKSNGIQMELKGVTHAWEVLTADGQPDFEFLKANVDRKFYIKYDPYDMDFVALYTATPSNGYRFETFAQKYLNIHRNIQEQDEFDSKFIRHTEIANKMLRVELQEQVEKIMEEHGMHPSQHGLNMPNIKGISAKSKNKKPKVKTDIGDYTKAVANMGYTEDMY